MSWRPALGGAARERALAIAREVATRVRDPGRVAKTAAAAREQTRFPSAQSWSPLGLAQGETGLALFFGACDASLPGEGWDREALRCLTSAARSIEGARPPAGAFAGLAGLAFTTHFLSHDGKRYRRLRDELEPALCREASAIAERFVPSAEGMPVHAFDLISGLSGIAVSLTPIAATAHGRAALEEACAALAKLAEPAELPRWYTPVALVPSPEMREEFPGGNLNCGLAHGIPGPLAALSLAYEAGIHTVAPAIRALADWLLASSVTDEWGLDWPAAVPVQDGRAMRPRQGSHAAWCYGGPGVAASLWLAQRALAEARYRTAALDAILALCARPFEARKIGSPGFCHGLAGMAHVIARFWNATGDQRMRAAIGEIVERLFAMWEPEDSLLGFRAIEPGRRVDTPGFLDGAPGAAASLLALATPAEPRWDRLFAVS